MPDCSQEEAALAAAEAAEATAQTEAAAAEQLATQKTAAYVAAQAATAQAAVDLFACEQGGAPESATVGKLLSMPTDCLGRASAELEIFNRHMRQRREEPS